ncbi:MAG: type IV toxin-antitoxin system AbiEi family antitoxin, partial [Bacteroidota bacterium]
GGGGGGAPRRALLCVWGPGPGGGGGGQPGGGAGGGGGANAIRPYKPLRCGLVELLPDGDERCFYVVRVMIATYANYCFCTIIKNVCFENSYICTIMENIVHQALENLFYHSGIIGEAREPAKGAIDLHDGSIYFLYRNHFFEKRYIVRKEFTHEDLDTFSSLPIEETLFIFSSATQKLKLAIKELGFSYLEISGNAFISSNNVLLFIDAKKSINTSAPKTSRAFSKTGLKLIYLFLTNPDALELSYRQIAELVDISIDTIGRIYKELVKDKYLVKYNDKHFRIHDYERLVHDWAVFFNKLIRPNLKSRSFACRDGEDITTLLNVEGNATIGGELAASKLAETLIPTKATVYLNGSFVDFALQNGLIPTQNGSIILVEIFWPAATGIWDNDKENKLASSVLIYADLLESPTPRNLEAMTQLLKKYAHNHR